MNRKDWHFLSGCLRMTGSDIYVWATLSELLPRPQEMLEKLGALKLLGTATTTTETTDDDRKIFDIFFAEAKKLGANVIKEPAYTDEAMNPPRRVEFFKSEKLS